MNRSEGKLDKISAAVLTSMSRTSFGVVVYTKLGNPEIDVQIPCYVRVFYSIDIISRSKLT